jgi:hypothetical protein
MVKPTATTTLSGDPIGNGSFGELDTGICGDAELFNERLLGEPIILAPSEGIGIRQDTNGGASGVALHAGIHFRTRA